MTAFLIGYTSVALGGEMVAQEEAETAEQAVSRAQAWVNVASGDLRLLWVAETPTMISGRPVYEIKKGVHLVPKGGKRL